MMHRFYNGSVSKRRTHYCLTLPPNWRCIGGIKYYGWMVNGSDDGGGGGGRTYISWNSYFSTFTCTESLYCNIYPLGGKCACHK